MCYWKMVAVGALFTFPAIEIDMMEALVPFSLRSPNLRGKPRTQQQRWWHRRYWWYNVGDQLELSL